MVTNILEYLEHSAKTHPDKIAFSDIYDLKYFNELLKDIGEAWKGFEEDSDEEYLLKFDPSFKKKIKRWVKEKIGIF